MRWIVGTLVTLIVITGVYNLAVVQHAPAQANQAFSDRVFTPQAMLTILNRERATAGVQPLKLDSRLNASAQAKADDMVQNEYYGHVNPKTGVTGYKLIPALQIGCKYISENITGPFPGNNPFSNKDDGWDYSKPHREAQLDARYDLVGFATAYDSSQGLQYYVAHFCDLR